MVMYRKRECAEYINDVLNQPETGIITHHKRDLEAYKA